MSRGTKLIVETIGDLHNQRAVYTDENEVDHDLSIASDTGTHRALTLDPGMGTVIEIPVSRKPRRAFV